ncbi:4-alpha-glucanotransferase [Rubrobacter xylanophilus DSM 9941]|uniref:4-alpha-glucanotransferase n=1 Tax=Rubrobacter xylanophilus TaxID=49319 RepID=UPI001C642F3C|nr:4-alpha-glucanotransferase [Rubrobacter xylanophilus]QYJ16475.1 4-alpha-glucanotransferase [Rubrobacter xylanophilus DSM 9941]
MRLERSAGILLHPTSLPGPHPSGELGEEALRFVRFLEEAGQRLWQVLPLNPTDSGGSPYSSYSAFAGNPLLVSTEWLSEDGLIERVPREVPAPRANYRRALAVKERLLREAYSRWEPDGGFECFYARHRFWLEDYALFMALRERLKRPWNEWPRELALREPGALRSARRELAREVGFHRFAQYRFFGDWSRVRRAAEEAGVRVIGDLPIFVSHDSADVWANGELFLLDRNGAPTAVAGVPPDYFSETGQLWGNPLYDWERMRREGYRWWVERVQAALALCDALRLDHFRGFAAFWAVPAGEHTAAGGRWVEGPGEDLFEALRRELGELPFIAEDLGEITPDVVRLRERLGLPGMKVLQFAFGGGPENPFLPHNWHEADWVTYTGTHDNDTTAGWWLSAADGERAFARRYLGREYVGVWDFIRLAYASAAGWAVIPMQDVLDLGTEARMNTPGTVEGNWSWRMEPEALTPELARSLRELAATYGRA